MKANDPIGMIALQNLQLQRKFYTLYLTCITRFKLSSGIPFPDRSQSSQKVEICRVSWNINNDTIITFDNFLDSGRYLSLECIED